MMMGFGYGGMGYGGLGFGIVGMIIQLAIIAGIVWTVVYLIKHATRKDSNFAPGSNARELLAERFARGEITEEEYKRMRDLL